MSQVTSGRAEGMERGKECEIREEGGMKRVRRKNVGGKGKGGLQEG